MRTFSQAAALCLAALATGCVAYNDPCQVVDRPDDIVGYVGEIVYLDKPNARHANNAIGQLAADGYRHSQDGSSSYPPAVLGVINGGGIRAEGFCGVSHTVVRKGPLSRDAIHQILLFDNLVVTLDLTVQEVVAIFASGAEGLSQEGQPIVSGPGNFLHPSAGTHVGIDCSIPPGTAGPGRITDLSVPGKVLVQGGVVVAPPPDKVRVAITDFNINFGGGTSEFLAGLDRDPTRNVLTGGIDSDIAEAYMHENYGTSDRALLVDPGRVTFANCATPEAPR